MSMANTPDMNEGSSSTTSEETALSNLLILKNIFSNLSYNDLVSSSNVNTIWMSVADSVIAHYRITLTTTMNREGCKIEVDEAVGLNGPETKEIEDFQGLIQLLRGCPRKEFMSITFRIITTGGHYCESEFESESYGLFLLEFGFRIHTLEYDSEFMMMYGQFLLHLKYMPSLEVLDCKELKLYGSYLGYGVNDAESLQRWALCNLRKICFGEDVELSYWHCLLTFAPNVKEIIGFPEKFLDFYFPVQFGANSVKLLRFEKFCGDQSQGNENESTSRKQCVVRSLSLVSSEGNTESNIKVRTEITYSAELFRKLVTGFPNVTELEVSTSLLHFTTVFPEIVAGWPLLEKLSLCFESWKDFRKLDASGNCLVDNFDSVFTGIPEAVCNDLRMGTDISPGEFGEKQLPSLVDLKNLRQLDFLVKLSDRDDGWCCNKKHVLEFISFVTAEYALKHLPHLRVGLRINVRESKLEDFKNFFQLSQYVEVDNTYQDVVV